MEEQMSMLGLIDHKAENEIICQRVTDGNSNVQSSGKAMGYIDTYVTPEIE